jgi:hypothetical protein
MEIIFICMPGYLPVTADFDTPLLQIIYSMALSYLQKGLTKM